MKTREKEDMVSRLILSMDVMSKLAVGEMNDRKESQMFEGLNCSSIARLHAYQFAVGTIAEDLGLATFVYSTDARSRLQDTAA